MKDSQPLIAVTLGDPAGIGPELIAKLLSETSLFANIHTVLVGDRWLWEEGQRKFKALLKPESIMNRSFCRSTVCPKARLAMPKRPQQAVPPYYQS